MQIPVARPRNQADLTALAGVLDETFGVQAPATMFRVGFMFDLLRSGQYLLLAGTAASPLGAVVALRGAGHVELVDMAVVPRAQGRGVGSVLFAELAAQARDQGFDTVRWSVSPTNLQAVGAYLGYGARMTGWVDDAYGVASDAFYTSDSTDRLRGEYRLEGRWDQVEAGRVRAVPVAELAVLRELLLAGGQVVGLDGGSYLVVVAAG